MQAKSFLWALLLTTSGASSAGAQVTAAPTLMAAATGELRARLVEQFPSVNRFEIRPLAAKEFPDASLVAMNVERIGSRSAVRASYRVDGRLRQALLWFDVAGFQDVVYALHMTPPLRQLSSMDVDIAQYDVVAAGCTPLTAREEAAGLRTRRAVQSGEALCKEWLEPQPAVAKGETVKVHYVSKSVAITTTGIARSDAHVGQRVAVANPTTLEVFTGEVSAPREVHLYER